MLDFGQIGGTLHGAGVALYSGHVLDGSDQTREARHDLPQANRSYVDVLGTSGKIVRWTGTIRTSTTAVMVAIIKAIEQRKHGSWRDVHGILGPANPAVMAPTAVTDGEGNILLGAARLEDLRLKGRRYAGTEWAAIQRVEIVFRG